MKQTQNSDGTYRFMIKLDNPATFNMAAAEPLGIVTIHWQHNTAKLACVAATTKDWYRTADDNSEIDFAFPCRNDKVPGSKPIQEASDELKEQVKANMPTPDTTAPWSAYGRNWQWALHAMGVTAPADDQSDPNDRVPKYMLTDTGAAGGTPYEGSGIVVGVFGANIPCWVDLSAAVTPSAKTALFRQAGDADIVLHPSFKRNTGGSGLYRDTALDSIAADSLFTEDPTAAEVHADGGVLGYDMAAGESLRTTCVPSRGDGTTTLPTSVNRSNITPGSVVMYNNSNPSLLVYDSDNGDGTGDLFGPGISPDNTATVTYATGAITANGAVWAATQSSYNYVVCQAGAATQKQIINRTASDVANRDRGKYSLMPLGVMASRAVGVEEIPNSAISPSAEQLAIVGRTRGLAPRSKYICYSYGQTPTTSTFDSSQLFWSILKAIEHNVQVFLITYETWFWRFDAFFLDTFRDVVKLAEQAGMMIIGGAGWEGQDLDQSTTNVSDIFMGKASNVLITGGTAPRFYNPEAADLNVYTPDPDRSPQPQENNLDRIAQISINLHPFYCILGFGSNQSSKYIDVVAPGGGYTPEYGVGDPGQPDENYPLVDCVITTQAGEGWFDFLNFGLHEFTHSAFGIYTVTAAAHAAAGFALAIERWYDKKTTWPPNHKAIRALMTSKAHGRVGPESDLIFVAANRETSTYATDPRYTLAHDSQTGDGDFFGYGSPFIVIGPSTDYPELSSWYSYEHPADTRLGPDSLYGKGRISLFDLMEQISA